jgi:ribosome-binding factor A
MAVDRLERVNALLRREIGEALYKVFADGTLDLASVTVTQVRAARNLRNATVSVSVFGHEGERGAIIRRLADKARELQACINRDLVLKYTPRLRFELDGSVEKGDHVLGVLSRLETAGGDDVADRDGFVAEGD